MPGKLPSPAKLKSLIAEVKAETTKRATGYAHPYSFYAKQYGRSLKQIKRYAKDGLPLDDPDAMGPHLDRHRGGKPNDDFEEDPPRAPLAAELEDAAAEAEARLNDIPADLMDAEGLEAEIRKLHQFARMTARNVRIAFAKNSPVAIGQALDNHGAVLEQMRKFEKDTPGILSRNEKQVPIADVEAKVGAVFLAFRQALDALPARAAGKMNGLDFTDRLELLQREVDLVKRTLEECDYLGADPLPAA